jgi:N-acetylglucosamine malate deacetylase 1
MSHKKENLVPIKYTEDQVPIVIPESIMVFAAHPDDELLSCGGTIMKYKDFGAQVTVVVATGGIGGYAKEDYKKTITNTRKEEMEKVSKMLDVEFLELDFDELEVNRFFIAKFTRLLRDHRPQMILLPHFTDVHRAHRNLSEIVREAIYHTATGKAYGGAGKQYTPKAIYYYESPSCKFEYIDASVFVNVDISKYWDRKVEIFNEAYSTQAEMIDRVLNWAEKTALLRGSEIGGKYAEAFIPSTEYVQLRILMF